MLKTQWRMCAMPAKYSASNKHGCTKGRLLRRSFVIEALNRKKIANHSENDKIETDHMKLGFSF